MKILCGSHGREHQPSVEVTGGQSRNSFRLHTEFQPIATVVHDYANIVHSITLLTLGGNKVKE